MTRKATNYPGIYLRNGKYEISYTDSNMVRRFKTVPGGLRDAQRARAKILERMHGGERIAPSKKTVAELADLYMDSAYHLRPRTRVTYESLIKAQVKPRIGNVKVSALTRRRIGALVGDMIQEDFTTWYIRGVLTVLSRMSAYAVEEGWLGANPVSQLDKNQRPKGQRKEMTILDSGGVYLLLSKSNGNYKDLFRLLIFTGLRIGEALALDWEDIDFDRSHLRVRTSKTSAGVRTVELPEFLLKSLASMEGVSGPVFLNQFSERMKYRVVARSFKATLKRAKLPDMRVHDLRHTYASLQISLGEDAVYVASQMGHSDPGMTYKIYAQLFDGDKRKAAARERMNSAFEGVGT